MLAENRHHRITPSPRPEASTHQIQATLAAPEAFVGTKRRGVTLQDDPKRISGACITKALRAIKPYHPSPAPHNPNKLRLARSLHKKLNSLRYNVSRQRTDSPNHNIN